MITEEQKFIAEVFKITGFAFITPLAREFLHIPIFTFSDFTFTYFFYLLICFILAYFGLVVILRAVEIVKDRRSS